MPNIYVNVDNSNQEDKLYSANLAGKSAAQAERVMQQTVKEIIDKASGFTTVKPEKAKGYTIRLWVSGFEVAGRQTKCSATGAIELYRGPGTHPGKGGPLLISSNWTGSATADGTSERAILDCVESLAQAMANRAVPVMRSDFPRR